MTLSPETERAIESCYDAIVMPSRWTGALDDLAHSLGATACIILPHEISDRQFGVVRSSGMQRLSELTERNQWNIPVYEPRGDPFVRHGYQAVSQFQLFTEDEIRRSRFHQEIARPAGCLQWASGIFSAAGRYWCLPVFRGTERFPPELREPLAEVSQRMARVVGISEKLSRNSAENELRTLERFGCPALLIDGRGRVSRSNRQAEDLFCKDFGLRHGRLWTSSGASLARLDQFIAQIVHSRPATSAMPAPVIVARGGNPWLLVEAMQVTMASLDVFDGCRAIVVVSDLTRPGFTDAALLDLVFGLTPAESRLAAALCEGQDIAAIAAAFGISRQTARSQLKAIFAKTGSRRQAELVARLAQIKSTVRH